MLILIVEDEPRMAALLRKGLSENGHDVAVASTGAEALKMTLNTDFNVILLDVGLPDLSGYDVAQVLLERRSPASILMLTAYSREDQIVRGLNSGADDYLTKPFSFPELLARLRAVTRPLDHSIPTYAVEDLAVDLIHRRVTRQGQVVDLTRTEFHLLEVLAQRSPRVAPRDTLIQAIWGGSKEVTPGALDVLINSLRSKIDFPFGTKLVQTVRGTGYLLKLETGSMPTMGSGARPQ